MRTPIIAMNANASLGRGILAYPIRSVSANPRSREAITAPGTEPKPPTTINARAL
jgi:hypothetical protein